MEQPGVKFEPQAPGAMIVLNAYIDGDRYDRYQGADSFTAGLATRLDWHTDRFVTNTLKLGADTTMRLLVDGVAVAEKTFPAGSQNGFWTFNSLDLTPGEHEFRIEGIPFGWTTPTVPMYVINGPIQPQTTMNVMLDTYDLMHSPDNAPVHQFAYVPAVLSPVTVPLAPRDTPAFWTIPDRGRLVMTELAKCRPDSIYRTSIDKRGIKFTANRQPYFWDDFLDPIPKLALLDGPRGRGTVVMPSSLQHGRNGKVYFTDPWRVGVVGADGAVKTLAGYRHDDMPTYWADNTKPSLLGDWSQVPEVRRGFHELWKMVWHPESLLLDPSAPLIGGESPHLATARFRGPVMFVTDSQNNRVCRLEFSATDRSVEPVVTEFITGLAYPWGAAVTEDGRQLLVSERNNSRICAYDIDTGERLRTWNFPFMVEGIDVLDGVVYLGSKQASNVFKLNPETGEYTPFRGVGTTMASWINNNSIFVDLAISKQGFGERGTLAMVTWSNIHYGWPNLFRPGGQEITYLWGGSPARVGLPWLGSMERPAPYYPSAVAFGPGTMLMGGSQEGLIRLSAALPTDVPAPATAYLAGQKKWRTRGYHLTHGHDGFGFFGLPLPWGDPDIDTYLQVHGHVKP